MTTGNLTLTSGAIFGSDVQGSGSTGPISITADSIVLDGRAPPSPGTPILLTGIHSSASGGSANAADITINTGTLTILANGQIVTDTSNFVLPVSTGNAGRVSVAVTGPLSIDATGALFSTGIGSIVGPNTAGNAGDITISAASLSIVGATFGPSPTPQYIGTEPFSGLSAQNLSLRSGRGGSISLNLGSGALAMSNGAVISASAFVGASGDAGSVTVVTPPSARA